MRRAARTALTLAAVTMLGFAGAEVEAGGQNGPAPAAPSATPEPASASKTGEGAGAKPEAGEATKPAETTPSAGAESPAPPTDSDSQSMTLAALMREGFDVRATTFVPADAVTRQSGKVSSDAIVMTLQKQAASAVCFYTLKTYVSKKLGTIPACTVHR